LSGLSAFPFPHGCPRNTFFLQYYHQTLLPDDQPILFFFFLSLQYLIYYI
jgi:hypothetical protein